MNNQHMDESLQRYYRSQQLAPEKLARLRALSQPGFQQEMPLKTPNVLTPLRQRIVQWHWCKTLAITVSVFVLFFTGGSVIRQFLWMPDGLGQQIANEISVNHVKQLAVEYTADNFSMLNISMNKLDFQMINPVGLRQFKFDILGARYCTIGGQIAAQIKLKDSTGQIMTLYQTRLSKKLVSVPKQDKVIQGVHILQWQENGLFLGLAKQE